LNKMDGLSFLRIIKSYKFNRCPINPINLTTQEAFDKNPGLHFVLVQKQMSPYSAKVRAYLEYNKIDFGLAEVNIFSKVDYRHLAPEGKVPILIAVEPSGRSNIIVESSFIISTLEAWRRTGNKEVLRKQPTKKEDLLELEGQGEEEKNWRDWADKQFIIKGVLPNAFGTVEFGENILNVCSKSGDWFNAFGTETVQKFYSYLPDLARNFGVTDKKPSEYREDLVRLANEWMDHIEKCDGGFSGGNMPDLADLAVFGSL